MLIRDTQTYVNPKERTSIGKKCMIDLEKNYNGNMAWSNFRAIAILAFITAAFLCSMKRFENSTYR